MAYHLAFDRTVAANVQRLLDEQIDQAIAQLSHQFYDTPEQAVHKARKGLKKGRAVLRLVRPAIGKAAYRRENGALRAIGQALAPARDGAVYQATLTDLLETYGLSLESHALADLQAYLGDRYQQELEALCDRKPGMDPIVADLKDSQARLREIPLKKTGWAALSKGLKQSYQQGQDRFATAYKNPSDEAFHDWRKRVKDLWYHTCLLNPLWPTVMEATEDEAHRLAKLLGDDHDIAALRQFLLDPTEAIAADGSLQVLLPLMDHRQAQLRQQAQGLGKKLYSETPKAFAKRIGHYWQIEGQNEWEDRLAAGCGL